MTVAEIKAAVRERDGMRCTRCGMTNAIHLTRFGKSLHVHRIVPGSRYGLAECVTVCWHCHRQKHRGGDSPHAIRRKLGRPVRTRPPDTELSNAYAKVLRDFRGRTGISQGELAHRAGISRQTVSLLENGAHSPNIVTFCVIADALGVCRCKMYNALPLAKMLRRLVPVDATKRRRPAP
jgi:DNA-binding XRE family transcriptional regulator